ncbi:hypothetical protein FHQ26_01160 [Testudinibacter sp. TR-2022]|uniref:hypothetical protein n=1 Tax=Testudinibacter sp. TR-2022 TaxID=2585029 RepID=UPI001118E5CB|nr:hypothetical protein [Testudinibacter sp. TR-2022]TNH04187.1 hypothetical protein FHQ22_05330 [Pasteurellaceae bacterium Phil31]TNH08817.1 hypothetical protein FHQ25_08890 [Testudinibacter sp. TR-2022]TNH12816.1 hypothetical protein FHQ26_01160 [Testudinibacter sp. TR-2022]TNH15478.1 hypothetical protein FIA56_03375 [Testudinibacter sp. TR-2022]TNH16867.1 hypothetical protein FHQ23_08320 [Testudinibacter sp. TR-2022]
MLTTLNINRILNAPDEIKKEISETLFSVENTSPTEEILFQQAEDFWRNLDSKKPSKKLTAAERKQLVQQIRNGKSAITVLGYDDNDFISE